MQRRVPADHPACPFTPKRRLGNRSTAEARPQGSFLATGRGKVTLALLCAVTFLDVEELPDPPGAQALVDGLHLGCGVFSPPAEMTWAAVIL